MFSLNCNCTVVTSITDTDCMGDFSLLLCATDQTDIVAKNQDSKIWGLHTCHSLFDNYK